MSELSPEHPKCPPGSHNRCYKGVCIRIYEYCSSLSKLAEPCVNEEFPKNKDFRETVCQAILQGKNATGVTIHPGCDMKTDCLREFKGKFYISKQGKDNSWILPTTICVVLVVAIFVAILVTAMLCYRKKAKRRQRQKELQDAFNYGDSAVEPANITNESRQSTNQEPSGTDTEDTQLLMRKIADAGNAANSPDAGTAPASRGGCIHRDSPSGSVSNTNSNSLSGSASVFIDLEPREVNRPSTSPNSTLHNCHPADK